MNFNGLIIYFLKFRVAYVTDIATDNELILKFGERSLRHGIKLDFFFVGLTAESFGNI